MTANWIPALLLIAAIALLPAWAVGGFALGAAAGLWIAKQTRARRQVENRALLPKNVIALPKRRPT